MTSYLPASVQHNHGVAASIFKQRHLDFVSECMNSGLTSHQQQGHMETGPRLKVSSERLEKWGSLLPSLDW